jgi:large subunit ribosomal protein L24
MKTKKDDTVKIISGKDRGKTGKVTHVFPKDNKVVVEGVNIRKKHVRPKKMGQKGQTIQMPMPIHSSNTMVVCPDCKKPTRIGGKSVGVKKMRVCIKCKGEF